MLIRSVIVIVCHWIVATFCLFSSFFCYSFVFFYYVCVSTCLMFCAKTENSRHHRRPRYPNRCRIENVSLRMQWKIRINRRPKQVSHNICLFELFTTEITRKAQVGGCESVEMRFAGRFISISHFNYVVRRSLTSWCFDNFFFLSNGWLNGRAVWAYLMIFSCMSGIEWSYSQSGEVVRFLSDNILSQSMPHTRAPPHKNDETLHYTFISSIFFVFGPSHRRHTAHKLPKIIITCCRNTSSLNYFPSTHAWQPRRRWKLINQTKRKEKKRNFSICFWCHLGRLSWSANDIRSKSHKENEFVSFSSLHLPFPPLPPNETINVAIIFNLFSLLRLLSVTLSLRNLFSFGDQVGTVIGWRIFLSSSAATCSTGFAFQKQQNPRAFVM